ncbi:MAG: DNA replication/repair protein RecF [Firmicutes bacterium]|nr:DNA replication/repair protein RecF [Bacillota bacterium]
MHIKSLSVQNFRNHNDTTVELSPGVNVFVGQNAQGKTNLLEAIFLSCVGRGWRSPRDRDMINFDANDARVKAVAVKSYGEVEVEMILSRLAKKSININGIPVQKMGELMGQINCIFFSPDELRLVKEAPADRRRFLDIDISQIDKSYFYSLLRYNKILAQRNSLLKSSSEDIGRGLDIWDSELVREGEKIVARRREFLKALSPAVIEVHNVLTGGMEEVRLEYETAKSPLQESLQAAREKDMRLKTTTVGPHRDDIKIVLDGKDARLFASQGQQRTIALSLKLAELKVFERLTGERPILLLDDVLSELDESRQARLLEIIQETQAIVTTTATKNLPLVFSIFNIEGGSVKTAAV